MERHHSSLADLPACATVDPDHLIALRFHPAVRDPIHLTQTGRPGTHPIKKRGVGLEIRDVRPFTEGDDFRHIDASVTARSGKMHVRSFHDDQDQTALLVADFRFPMLWGTQGKLRSVTAAECLALAGWQVLHAGGRLGLLILMAARTVYVPPHGRDTAMVQIATALANGHREALESARSTAGRICPALDAQVEQILRITPKGGSVLLATGLDTPGQNLRNTLHELASRARLEVLLIRDALERNPPRHELPYFTADPATRWGKLTRNTETAHADMLRDIGVSVTVIDTDTLMESVDANT